jgi:hypothetical protein
MQNSLKKGRRLYNRGLRGQSSLSDFQLMHAAETRPVFILGISLSPHKERSQAGFFPIADRVPGCYA